VNVTLDPHVTPNCHRSAGKSVTSLIQDGVHHSSGRNDTSCEGKEDSSDSRRAHPG